MKFYVVNGRSGFLNKINLVQIFLISLFLFTANANAASPWTSLLGTVEDDYGDDIAVDASGNSYVVGDTGGDLGGTFQGNFADMYVAKFGPSGNVDWVTQIGTIEFDRATRVALDNAGNVYVTGYTAGNMFEGAEGDGFFDYFIAKFDNNGNLLWGKQYGGPLGQYGFGIDVAPNGDIYTCGMQYQLIPNAAVTYYAFITKYDSNGTQLWTDVFGAPTVGAGGNQADEVCRDVAVGGDGAIYITGSAGDSLTANGPGGGDIFFAKYTSGGSRLWLTETGTTLWDRAGKIAVDAAGNSYTSGWTAAGGLDFGDMLTVKVSTNGVRLWERRVSTTTLDEGTSVAVDANGVVYAAGRYGVGPALAVVKYDSNGNELSIDTMSSNNGDFANAIAFDPAGANYYITGYTGGNLGGQNNNGGMDIFVVHNQPAAVPNVALITVPSVIGWTENDAIAEIEGAGLVANVSYVNSTVTAGNVISQNPAAGTNVAGGSTVNLAVSLGAAPALIVVPDVVGDILNTAITTIENAGLTVGNITTVRTRRSCGIVRSQTPDGGVEVAPGTAVDLVVTRTRFCNPL